MPHSTAGCMLSSVEQDTGIVHVVSSGYIPDWLCGGLQLLTNASHGACESAFFFILKKKVAVTAWSDGNS